LNPAASPPWSALTQSQATREHSRLCIVSFQGVFPDTTFLVSLANGRRDATLLIQYEERAYTVALNYDAEKREIIKVNDSKLEFCGSPSKSIDEAWQYLLHGSLDTTRITLKDCR
jgi:hypothetical protein